MESYQIAKYSSRKKGQIKKTISPSGKTEEEIQKIKEDFFNSVDEDNKKFREEIKQLKQSKLAPKKFIRVPNNVSVEAEIETKQITPEGEIKQEIKTENGITTIKETIKKETNTGEQVIKKSYQTSKIDTLKPTNTINIMNNQDLIKNIENKSGNTFLMVGASKSGKTTYLIDLVNALHNTYQSIYKKPIIILFSHTMTNDGGIYNRLPKDTILYDHYDEKIIKTIEKVQKKTNKKYPVIIILDDIVDKKNNTTLSKLLTIYRNLNISSVILLQRLKMFDKNNRSNVNYVFGLKQNTNEAINDMIEVFFKGILTNDDYINLTKNYNKIFIDNLNNQIYHMNN